MMDDVGSTDSLVQPHLTSPLRGAAGKSRHPTVISAKQDGRRLFLPSTGQGRQKDSRSRCRCRPDAASRAQQAPQAPTFRAKHLLLSRSLAARELSPVGQGSRCGYSSVSLLRLHPRLMRGTDAWWTLAVRLVCLAGWQATGNPRMRWTCKLRCAA